MNDTFSKSERRELRRLAAEAHKRELSTASLALLERFQDWRDEKIDVFDLNDEIHKFHNGVSRELFTLYSARSSTMPVVSAIAAGVLNADDVSENVMSKLESSVQSLLEYWRE